MPTLETLSSPLRLARTAFVYQRCLLIKPVLLSYQQMARTYDMISLASAYLARALGARLQHYRVQCKFLKNGTLELVLTHIDSRETYAISGIAKMNYFNTLAVTRLAGFLLSEIETCQRWSLLNSGALPATRQRKTERRSVKNPVPTAGFSLFGV